MVIRLFPEQLQKKLNKSFDYDCYVFFGKDIFLLEDTKNFVLEHIKSFNSYEYYHFPLNNKLLLEKIIIPYRTKSLFDHKKKFFYLVYFKNDLITKY